MANFIDDWKNETSEANINQAIVNIRGRLGQYTSNKVLPSSNPDAQAVELIRKGNGEFRALTALALATDPSMDLSKGALLPGATMRCCQTRIRHEDEQPVAVKLVEFNHVGIWLIVLKLICHCGAATPLRVRS